MIISFACPSAPHPIGGVTVLYGFANALVRLGHRVHLIHTPFFRNRIESLDDIAWFPFDRRVEHHLVAPGGDLPPADVLFGVGGRPEHGLPAVLIQGFEMLHLGLERQAFRSRALKVCVASWLVDVGRRFGVDPDQVVVVPLGLDLDRFRVVTPLDHRPPTVGLLHSTHPAKRWDLGLHALHHARERAPQLRALAFGTSAPTGAVPAWMDVVVDPEPDALVRDVYNRCRVFLQPSDYEGFGLTALESMACGAALVTTDNGGSRDYAVHDRTALVVPPGDATALGAAVADLLVDDDRRQRLGAAGRTVAATYTWARAARAMTTVLDDYLRDPERYLRPPGPEQPAPGASSDPFALR